MSPVPSATAVRRRRTAVLAAAGAAFVLGATLGSGHQSEAPSATPRAAAPDVQPAQTPVATPTPTPDALRGMSLSEQVGKLVVLRFNGTGVPPYVTRILREGEASGAILFGPNLTSPEQLRAITTTLDRAGRAAGAPPIVCTDQEGGAVRSVAWAPP